MAYYIRVLSPSDKPIPASDLARALKDGSLTVEDGTDGDWTQLLLTSAGGQEIAVIERNVVSPGSMGQEELDEFIEDTDDLKPRSGAQWLKTYLPTVKTVYAFQLLGKLSDADWSAVGAVKAKLWNARGGIFQADGEGFSNEDGYHIVWQFSDRVSGTWWMGLLADGAWVHFEMDLGDRTQRDLFLEGSVPPGAKLASQH